MASKSSKNSSLSSHEGSSRSFSCILSFMAALHILQLLQIQKNLHLPLLIHGLLRSANPFSHATHSCGGLHCSGKTSWRHKLIQAHVIANFSDVRVRNMRCLQRGAVAAIKLQKPMPKMMQNSQNVVFIRVMASAQKMRPTKLAASCNDKAFPMLAPNPSSSAPSHIRKTFASACMSDRNTS